MGLFGLGEKRKPSAYDLMVEGEREKARAGLLKEQAVARGRQLAQKDAEAARFGGLSRGERAKERLQRARGAVTRVSGGLSALGAKMDAAGKRFDQKAAALGGQKQGGGSALPAYLQGSGGSSMPSYLRPAEAKKKREGGKTITIRVS